MSEEKLWDQEYREHHIASSFKGTLSRSVTFLKEFLKQRGEALAGLKILDCGCGNGRNAIPLAEMGNMVYGIDISKTALVEIAERIRVKNAIAKRLFVDCCSMAKPLRFKDGFFDVVADITSFDILLTPDEINMHAREVWRVLKSEGCFLYYDMNADDPYALWLKSLGRARAGGVIISPEPAPIPFKIYSLAEIQMIFANFELLTSEIFRFKDTMYGREHDRALLCAIFRPKK